MLDSLCSKMKILLICIIIGFMKTECTTQTKDWHTETTQLPTSTDATDLKTTDIRLVNGRYPWQGRVEVFYNNTWGTICDDRFDRIDAQVVCSMLGYDRNGDIYAYGNAAFGQGNGPIMLDDLHCNGKETDISECPSNGWFANNCGHHEDAGVSCNVSTTDIRLVNGRYPWQGRVEVFYNNTWGTICDDSFDRIDAQVVCSMLGYDRNGDIYAYGNAAFGQGNGPIMLDDLHCNGKEIDISVCPSNGWFANNCGHNEDAGVSCNVSTTDIRLVNGQYSWEGRVEVFYNNTWGTICDDSFDRKEAQVICAMLGYDRNGNIQAWNGGVFGQGNGPIMLDGLYCNGRETDISVCPSNGWFKSNCRHNKDAGVRCKARVLNTTDIRLANGNFPWEGRVEVFYNNQWGTVCDNNFDTHEAQVICSMLGYDRNGNIKAYGGAAFGQGNGSIMLDDLNCNGQETVISECPSRYWNTSNCQHSEDASVSCKLPPSQDIRLVNGKYPWEGRVEVLYNNSWGTICDDSFDRNEAKVICSMLGYDRNGNIKAYSRAAFGQGNGTIMLDNLNCKGTENDISECPSNGWFNHNCHHTEDAGVSCKGDVTTEATTTYGYDETTHVLGNQGNV